MHATVILGRDSMRRHAPEDEFQAWVSYVGQRLGDAVDMPVHVVARDADDVQTDGYGCSEEQAAELWEAVSGLRQTWREAYG